MFLQLFFFFLTQMQVLSCKMAALSSAGCAWSFTSLMNMKTISNKCHSCLNCLICNQMNTPGKGFSLFVSIHPALVYRITCSRTWELLIITRIQCSWGPGALLTRTVTGDWKDAQLLQKCFLFSVWGSKPVKFSSHSYLISCKPR